MTHREQRKSEHPLRFVRALALITAAVPACVMQEEATPPPLNGQSSGGGGVVVQGNTNVVQGNDAVIVQQQQPNGEDRVQMQTVVVGGQTQTQTVLVQPAPVCVEGDVRMENPVQRCQCVRGPAGLQWVCQERQMHQHMVGPLPPPTLSS
jgi:hypothetical protein